MKVLHSFAALAPALRRTYIHESAKSLFQVNQSIEIA
jgi:hypothetical protein